MAAAHLIVIALGGADARASRSIAEVPCPLAARDGVRSVPGAMGAASVPRPLEA